jgi:hypothetical protein
MRIKLAADLVKAYKKGDKTKCGTEVQNNQNSINAYCDKVFVEDPAQNIACKVKEDFCFICCQSEFGSFRMSDRKECIK